MEKLVRFQSKGLVTIPKRFRQELGLEKDSLAKIKKEKGKLILEPIRTLPYPVRSYSGKELEKFLEIDSEETKELKKKGLL